MMVKALLCIKGDRYGNQCTQISGSYFGRHFRTHSSSRHCCGIQEDGIADALTKVFADVRAAIEKDQLIQADLVVDFPEPTTITVETGIINLPFANVNKIPNFLEPDEIVPVRVYLIVASPLSTYQVCALMKPRLPLIICRILTRSMPK